MGARFEQCQSIAVSHQKLEDLQGPIGTHQKVNLEKTIFE